MNESVHPLWAQKTQTSRTARLAGPQWSMAQSEARGRESGPSMGGPNATSQSIHQIPLSNIIKSGRLCALPTLTSSPSHVPDTPSPYKRGSHFLSHGLSHAESASESLHLTTCPFLLPPNSHSSFRF